MVTDEVENGIEVGEVAGGDSVKAVEVRMERSLTLALTLVLVSVDKEMRPFLSVVALFDISDSD